MAELTLQEQIAALTAQNAALTAAVMGTKKALGAVSYEISEKTGCIIIRNLNGSRFPINMHADQAARLVADVDNFKAFLATNKARFDAQQHHRAVARRVAVRRACCERSLNLRLG